MKVTVFLSDGGKLTIEDFDQSTAMDMLEDLQEGGFITLHMDGGIVVVNTGHIVRVDVD